MTSPVSFISPLTITASMITSSTAVTHSTTESEWSAMGTYTVGTVVFRPSVSRRFQNQVPGMNANAPEDDQVRWYDLGLADKMTMFDDQVGTQSIADGTLTTVFRPGAFDAMDLRALDGTGLAVTIKDAPGGAVVHSFTDPLEGSAPDDYFDHFFAPYKPKTDFLATGLAPYASCEVTISVSYPGGIPKCGMASLGALTSLGGPALSGVSVEPKSYARITTDERGKITIKKGKAARDLAIEAFIPLEDADRVVDALTQVMSTPCTVIATDSITKRALRTFGLPNGKITYGSNRATLSLTVQGTI